MELGQGERQRLTGDQSPRPISLRTFANEDPSQPGTSCPYTGPSWLAGLTLPKWGSKASPAKSFLTLSGGQELQESSQVCAVPPQPQSRAGRTGREAQSGWGPAPGITLSGQGLAPPRAGSTWSWLHVTEALGSRKCLGNGLGSGFTKLLQPSCLDLLPTSPASPAPSEPTLPLRSPVGQAATQTPGNLLGPSALPSSLALASHRLGPTSPWPNPGPVLHPLGFTAVFCCQRRALRNCWHCQKPRVRYDSPNIPLFLLFC